MAHILIVDDKTDLVNYLAVELETAGFETGTACDGLNAVHSVLDGGWDAVLMETDMPNLNGLEALRIIRRVAPELPVVMFTSKADQGYRRTSTQLGALTCLLKPVEVGKLVKTLRQAVPERHLANGAALAEVLPAAREGVQHVRRAL